jgi:hypothetical protein
MKEMLQPHDSLNVKLKHDPLLKEFNAQKYKRDGIKTMSDFLRAKKLQWIEQEHVDGARTKDGYVKMTSLVDIGAGAQGNMDRELTVADNANAPCVYCMAVE